MTASSSSDQRLALMQLSDSFFPSGSYTLSHGLESLVHSGAVCSTEDFQSYLTVLLHNKVGSSDLVALVHAYRACQTSDWAEVRNADLTLFAQTLIQETRDAQRKSGRALLMVARSTWPNTLLEKIHTDLESGLMHGLHPVVFAGVGWAANLNESNTMLAFLHNFVTGLCGAAIRLGILGHIRAQQIINAIALDIEAVMTQATQLELDEMWSCTPLIDVAQMTHRRLPLKLFSN